MTGTRVLYRSPRGQHVIFGTSGPYLLSNMFAGFSSTLGDLETVKSPGQVGATLSVARSGTRTVEFPVVIDGGGREGTWKARQDLAAALWTPPTRPGREPQRGTLTVYREGQEPVEARAIPVDSPSAESWIGAGACKVDLEFAIPGGVWRAISDVTVTLGQVGGFDFPLAHPWSSLSASLTAEVDNPGTVETPMFVRVDGELTDLTMTVLDLDPQPSIVIVGTLAAGERYEIDTAPDRLTVELVRADGTRENALSRVDLDVSDLSGFVLPPGMPRIDFRAANNVSGRTFVTFRPSYAGV